MKVVFRLAGRPRPLVPGDAMVDSYPMNLPEKNLDAWWLPSGNLPAVIQRIPSDRTSPCNG